MKTKKLNLKMPTKKSDLKWYTLEQVFGKYRKNKEFQRGYREESARLSLATKLRKVRQEKKMTQQAVAEKASMPQSVIARLESGTHSVSVDTLNRVAVALGKEVTIA